MYEHRAGHDIDDDALVDPLEFLARVLIHVPQPNKHLVHFYGAYANRVRSTLPLSHAPDEPSQHLPPRRALTKRWAELIYRIYDVDPLTCRCGAEMKIIAFVTEPAAIRKILDHRNHKRPRPRAPPSPGETIVHSVSLLCTPLVCLETVKPLPVLFLLMRALGSAIACEHSPDLVHPIRVNSAPASPQTRIECPILQELETLELRHEEVLDEGFVRVFVDYNPENYFLELDTFIGVRGE